MRTFLRLYCLYRRGGMSVRVSVMRASRAFRTSM